MSATDGNDDGEPSEYVDPVPAAVLGEFASVST